MEKLKDELDQRTQSYLSLNFLMADFNCEEEENPDRVENLVFSSDSNNPLKKDISDDRELYFCATYHKYISRTYDLGKCRKEE